MSATVSQIFRNVGVCIYICVCACVYLCMCRKGNTNIWELWINSMQNFCTVLQLLYKSEIIYNKKLKIILKSKSMAFYYIDFKKGAIVLFSDDSFL